jgi:hypothetical protein
MISGAMIGLLYGAIIGGALTMLLDNDKWFINNLPIVGVFLGVGWWSYNEGIEAGADLERSLTRPPESQETALDHTIEMLERGEKESAEYWGALSDRAEQQKRSDKV